MHQHHRAANHTTMRRAILQALEELHDCHLRSNMDAIRRNTQAILAEEQQQDDESWNETLFWNTIKSVVKDGVVDLTVPCRTAGNAAELSSEFKRKRADSVTQRRQSHQQQQEHLQQLQPSQSLQNAVLYSPQHHNHHNHHHPSSKDTVVRKSEHDKWKIVPKNIYDKTISINPMDTH